MTFSTNQITTESLCGEALCVGKGGGRAADGGHEAKRFAAQAFREASHV
jgi:hypothetical protein